MPPRCCRPQEHIPLKYVDKLFDDSFKMKWNKKYHEYTTKNRLYCPKRGCGEWIRPANIHADTSSGATGGRKYGICTRCKTKVCALCNNKWHPSRTCPKDEETRKFIETAKQEGWKRCFNCSAMVELKEGCNHMTCRCTAEFCMICGAKWKTCDCPWFNYDTVEQDRLLHMNVPHARQVHANDPAAANAPHAYHEELDRRRDQEARDEALARRLQGFGDDEDDTLAPENVNGNIIGIGNAAGHFLNQDFIRRATGFLTGNFGQGIDRVAQETRDNDANLLRPPAALLQAERAERAAARAQMRPPQAHLPVRARTNASRRHNNAPIATAEELAVPGHTTHNYATEATRHHPAAERRGTRRVSTLAGLTNGARGQGRVSGWLNGVAIGSNPHE
ncbi:MAG: hypothetical protein M1834_001146 [Cirrosporium novae-zelandiae]|nr:MAG: hypothetical protein M1834_001146 [Cirrosporium novae-zelandiae]